MKNVKVILGFLSGIASGMLLGILSAPDKGVSTRRKIASKGDEYISDIGENFDSMKEGINRKFVSTKKQVLDEIENGKAKQNPSKDTYTDIN